MNKLQGFYELTETGLPCVPWREFTAGTSLGQGLLWTIRSAVVSGDDQNLPRLIGAPAARAEAFARGLLRDIRGMVIYYPYFVADKSGTLEVRPDSLIIECIAGDLWHMVSEGERAVTYMIADGETRAVGDGGFLSDAELARLTACAPRVRGRLRAHMAEGRSALLEWSFARQCDVDGAPVGDSSLVFYELRTL